MPDAADRASEHEEALRAMALKRVLSVPTARGRNDCIDCGEEIPEARRAADPSTVTCIDCQRDRERPAR
ncbi:TraR/DksA C4-type zinc finger protein [Thalassobaculum litoreum]|uniref:TraR/DksA C4-type zinc finger protein n=1 Tax=Thalassobaculum litoreum TaxID=420996 RepID=UPI001FDF39F4|nr:TraR/DksA C4-type zinc finger protein [Thalassobaculum litoreum]